MISIIHFQVYEKFLKSIYQLYTRSVSILDF